jgi:hypothetical protein
MSAARAATPGGIRQRSSRIARRIRGTASATPYPTATTAEAARPTATPAGTASGASPSSGETDQEAEPEQPERHEGTADDAGARRGAVSPRVHRQQDHQQPGQGRHGSQVRLHALILPATACRSNCRDASRSQPDRTNHLSRSRGSVRSAFRRGPPRCFRGPAGSARRMDVVLDDSGLAGRTDLLAEDPGEVAGIAARVQARVPKITGT